MKQIPLILLLILSVNCFSQEKMFDYFQTEEKNNKPVLLLFYSYDCPYCQSIDRELAESGNLRDYIQKNYSVELINISTSYGKEVALRHGIKGVPTMVRFSEQKDAFIKLVGNQPAAKITDFVTPEVSVVNNSGSSVRVSFCGDGIPEGREACDDGNMVNGDGCESDCTVTPDTFCGDGIPEGTEACDDGNLVNGDGCESDCTVTSDAICGDGIIEGSEMCDDGNISPSDGCSDACRVEEGWQCEGVPSLCEEIVLSTFCGDGIPEGTEACDDGNLINGDGCESDCTVTSDAICGDGIIEGSESCDDGNISPNDGCSDGCNVEEGWQCAGMPSLCEEIVLSTFCGDGIPEGTESCDDGNLINGDGCESDCTVTSVGLSVGEIMSFTVSPNPFSEYLTISVNASEYSTIDVSLFDVQGKCIYQQLSWINGVGNNAMQLSGSEMPVPGLYYLQIRLKTAQGISLYNTKLIKH